MLEKYVKTEKNYINHGVTSLKTSMESYRTHVLNRIQECECNNNNDCLNIIVLSFITIFLLIFFFFLHTIRVGDMNDKCNF